MDENIVIKNVLDNPFSVRPLRDKLTTVENEWPSAPLPNLMTVHTTKSNTQNILASLCLKTYGQYEVAAYMYFTSTVITFLHIR